MSEHHNKEEQEEMSPVVVQLASIILGLGVIGAVLIFSPIPLMELLNVFLFVLLPMLLIAAGLGLVSMGTVQMIWHFDLADRVKAAVEERRAAQASS